MIVIRDKQLKEIKQAIDQSWHKEFVERLRQDLPEQTSQMSDEELAEDVRLNHENATELEIVEKEDVYRFIKLSFLPKEFLEEDFIQSVVIRVLNNLNLSATNRLDFIEQQVVPRAKL